MRNLSHEKSHCIPMMCAALRAALLPGAPMTPPPGWAPDPQSSSLLTGVAGPGLQSVVGLAKYSWSSDIDPWKMFPPVSPNTLSSSGGGRTSLPTILSLKPGAYLQRIKHFTIVLGNLLNADYYLSMLSNTTLAYSSFFASSHVPLVRW